ncbi:unnamed protein product [Nyctereutes procyonoides]|uniref:Reticulon n=1 Tax=Nyctereutes procyonoides TaxID=34880 RepID=A0A811ZXB4_NYCPR|nr:unnamed protein product [Nyctereutes procyonoides]
MESPERRQWSGWPSPPSCAVHDLIFWKDAKKTGFVSDTTLIMLLSPWQLSVSSVWFLTSSWLFCHHQLQGVQVSYLDVDITVSSEAFHNHVNAAMVHINRALKLIIRLFLVEDLVDSLKLDVFMWLMTYVGAIFNGITLLILEMRAHTKVIVIKHSKAQSWGPGIESHIGLLVHGACFSLCLFFCLLYAYMQVKFPGEKDIMALASLKRLSGT